MTSSLRRKPPITAQRSRQARTKPRLAAAQIAWLAAAAALLIADVKAADDGPALPSLVQSADYQAAPATLNTVEQVTYTTGTAGHRLKWSPSRGSGSSSGETQLAQFTTPVAPTPAPNKDPFVDPFGDKGAVSSAQPAKPLDDKLLEGITLKPVPAPTLPQFTAQPVTPPAGGAAEEESDVPDIESLVQGGPQLEASECPPEGTAYFSAIKDVKIDIRPEGDKLPPECKLASNNYEPRAWEPVTFTWTASALCHKPLYFEQPGMERYGHVPGPILTPFVSAGHFFLSVPILPYKMGLYPPGECMYTLGYYRPGNCAPYIIDPLPVSIRAGLMQAAAVVGAVYLIP